MDLRGINSYWQQLSSDDIAANKHRDFVGGLWDELGQLQFDFLKEQGLLPQNKLLDVGCGALRGGLYFIEYLERGNYFGLDINASLIEAGVSELAKANLANQQANLLVDTNFNASLFGVRFDFAIAQSLFTHLPMNLIEYCLVEVRKTLQPGGKFFATFFQAPHPAHVEPFAQPTLTTYFDQDPFHYSFEEVHALGKFAGLEATLIGDWKHPHAQQMIVFYPS
jgi:SAM-dependent methyltransferase